MALVGYARVSTKGQSLDVQLDLLKDCSKIFKEKESGTKDNRPRLKACLEYVREGDTLVATRLDRLARSTLHLCKISEELDRKRVDLHIISQNLNTADATGRLLFNVLASISQFENEIRAERQAEGIEKAKTKGIKFGRKRAISENQIVALQKRRADGEIISSLAKHYNISRASVYRYLSSPTTGE